jgi:hypothetical protein
MDEKVSSVRVLIAAGFALKRRGRTGNRVENIAAKRCTASFLD